MLRGLWRATVDASREAGYQELTAQASAASTRAILTEELGFSQVAAVDYATYEVPHAEAAASGYTGKAFAPLLDRNKAQFAGGLTIHVRRRARGRAPGAARSRRGALRGGAAPPIGSPGARRH